MHKIIRNLLLVIYVSLAFLFIGRCYGVPSWTTQVTCSSDAAITGNWPPRYIFVWTCTGHLGGLTHNDVYTLSTNFTDSLSGSGADGNFTLTDNANDTGNDRFQISTSSHTSTSAAHNVNSSDTVFMTWAGSAAGTKTVTFYPMYRTYQSDVGSITYNGPSFIVTLKDTTTPITPITTPALNLSSFTTISTSYFPTASFTASTSVPLVDATLYGTKIPANTVTVYVVANNAWQLQLKMPNLIYTTYSIPATSIGYVVSLANNCANQVTSTTLFAVANTNYTLCTNNTGVYTTGSSDGLSLSGTATYIQIPFIVDITSLFYPETFSTSATYTLSTY